MLGLSRNRTGHFLESQSALHYSLQWPVSLHFTTPVVQCHPQSEKDLHPLIKFFCLTGRPFIQISQSLNSSAQNFIIFCCTAELKQTWVHRAGESQPTAAMNQRSFSLPKVPLKSDFNENTKLNNAHDYSFNLYLRSDFQF